MSEMPWKLSSASVDEAARIDVEALAAAYERAHPEDTFDDLRRRAAFDKQDRLLLRQWLAAAERRPVR